MKLTTAFVALATMASTAAAATISGGKTISAKTAQKLVRRRIEDADAEEEEFAFLGNYHVKVVGCKQALETPIMNEDGEYEYSAVLLRLCPSSDTCDSATDSGCTSGYGEMLVGMSTFVEAYFEDQEDDEDENGDDFEVDKYSKCEEYNPDENADDGNQGAWDNYAFYVGPTCTEDNLGLKLELFTDEYCTQVSETTFETISNGWTLPYSTGGLVSTNCQSCSEYNDDGEAEIKEVCQQSYENAAMKCEESMEIFSYYGQNVAGCETLAEMFPAAKGGNGGKIFGWIVLASVAVGLVGYIVWWRKKKATSIEN
jgi:hypothetical protein